MLPQRSGDKCRSVVKIVETFFDDETRQITQREGRTTMSPRLNLYNIRMYVKLEKE